MKKQLIGLLFYILSAACPLLVWAQKGTVSGIKVWPRQDMETSRIKDFSPYLAEKLFNGP
ncbi:hypothetical protein CA265_05330 [Sphingobacteriaceae bacterium GW460-11-11-14-LB5]|nr:hypothetical protein CA265_05330 [Sphingobacteriaceae bacterium GW460-11-11-14-LB5]